MSDLQLVLIALLPSIGTLVSGLVMLFKVIFQFKSLRAEVRDDSTIVNLKNDNQVLRAMVRSTQDQLQEATLQTRAVADMIREKEGKEDLILEELEVMKRNGRSNQ